MKMIFHAVLFSHTISFTTRAHSAAESSDVRIFGRRNAVHKTSNICGCMLRVRIMYWPLKVLNILAQISYHKVSALSCSSAKLPLWLRIAQFLHDWKFSTIISNASQRKSLTSLSFILMICCCSRGYIRVFGFDSWRRGWLTHFYSCVSFVFDGGHDTWYWTWWPPCRGGTMFKTVYWRVDLIG